MGGEGREINSVGSRVPRQGLGGMGELPLSRQAFGWDFTPSFTVRHPQ